MTSRSITATELAAKLARQGLRADADLVAGWLEEWVGFGIVERVLAHPVEYRLTAQGLALARGLLLAGYSDDEAAA